MLTVMLLMLGVGPFTPTWVPKFPLGPTIAARFQRIMPQLPRHLQPSNQKEVDCFWAADLQWLATLDPQAKALVEEAKKYIKDHCNDGDPDGKFGSKWLQAFHFLYGGQERTRLEPVAANPTSAPFQLPPLPDRAGGDLGEPLLPMFLMLETRLAAGGHRLDDGARACAWAASALSAAQAVQRTPGATDGIAAGARALEAQQVARCQGAARAQKEAAWAWIRAHPGATQPLVVPLRPTAAGPTLGPADGALWFGAALLILAPEAWPAFLVLAPASR